MKEVNVHIPNGASSLALQPSHPYCLLMPEAIQNIVEKVKCNHHKIQKKMNKAENVPIATLSGIASLTEITPELPLPSSTCTSRDIQLFRSEDDATESIKLVADSSHSQQQIESFEKLLCSVNNAYLDFKNAINNRPCVFTDIPHLPPIIQHVTKNKPDVFQPHFDTYHGSPLKTNNVSALAYSPNHRNTFIMHQQQQQQQQQKLQSSLQGTQTSYSSNSPVPTNHDGDHKIITADEAPPCSPLTINVDSVLRNTTKTQSDDVVCSQGNEKDKVNGQCTDEMDLNQFVPAEIVSHNELNEIELRLHKKRKKKHKQKRKRIGSNNDENNEINENNELDNQKLTLRIPKLIVRKVKQDNEMEILEVSRKDKEKLQVHEHIRSNVNEELTENKQNERTVNEEYVLKNPSLKDSGMHLILDEKQNKLLATQGKKVKVPASIAADKQKKNGATVICRDNSLKPNETVTTGGENVPTPVVEEQKQNGNNSVTCSKDIPKPRKPHNLSPVSVVVNKLQDDILEKNLKKNVKTKSPVKCAEEASRTKKRLRNDVSSVSSDEVTLDQVQKRKKREGSSDEETLDQVQKRKRGGKKETDEEPMEIETITKACRKSGKEKKSSRSRRSQSSDDEVIITKTREKTGKQKKSRSSRRSHHESSDDEVVATRESPKTEVEQCASTTPCVDNTWRDGYMESEPGCSSGSNVRRGRKKPVNYKEAKSESENADSEDSDKPVKVKVKKRKSKTTRKVSSASDEDFNPTEEKRSARGSTRHEERGSGKRSRNHARTPSPDGKDQADWSTPALDPYWDEESDENNEEMENLKQELAAQGAKTDVKKFMFLMEKIFEHELEIEADGNVDINDDVEIPPELLISKPLISALCTEVAKMKSSGKLCEMPADQLVRTIAIMDRHVKDSIHLTPTRDADEGDENRKWYNLQIERVVRSAESAAVILHITTSPDMPKQVFLEEAIERVVVLCQYQLENTIFPAFDPIYNVAGDGDCISKKSRRYNRSTGVRSKHVKKVYNKFCEVVSLLSHLLSAGTLTDSIILKMSQIGISPFFVEHVSILQLEALKVSRAIFRTYVKHRDLILEDILASLSRLPSSKRNLRTYRLNGNEMIQMFTALVLQLIQCTVQIQTTKELSDSQKENSVDKDVLIVKSYEDALRAARNFLSIFLKKCSSRDHENDYRPLFENFLHDLFTTANLPEWPAAEVVLTQLGHLFVVTFSNTKLEMTLRTTALDYLSQIATHLRKAALRSGAEGVKEKLISIVGMLLKTKDMEEEVTVTDDMEVYDENLRKALLLFLLSSSGSDISFKYAREFYMGQWIRDIQMEIEKSIMAPQGSVPGAAGNKREEREERKKCKDAAEKLLVLQEKKKFYHTLIDDTTVSTLKSSQSLDYDSACTTIDHLASSRSFSLSFDLYMQQIFKMLSEQAIALRTRAVKALTMIVSVDPNILAREDVQASVHGRLLDPSTNVREAAVDLIGQFVLKCPNLIKQYYDMIIARILDTGVSVRKRVIKILRDICIEHPDFEKIPEICAKMIRRIEDESGIKKLVTEVFRAMWFQPVKTKGTDELYHKAVNITKVISMCKETGFDWLESLLNSLFDTTESQAVSNVAITACQQLVDCLVTRLLKPELKCETNTVVPCLITLHLFCKAQPALLIHHATTLQPYLSSKIETPTDSLIIQHVSKILEIVVPLMEHPSPKFLADLEEDSMKLMLKQSQNVVQSCASCLAAIINNVTHNYKFIVDGFTHFYKFLIYYKCEHSKDPTNSALKAKRPTLLRALFTIGLFCRHFDLDIHVPDGELAEEKKKDEARSEQVFDLCMYYTDFADEMITLKAILAIGFIGVRYPQLLLKDACRNLYQEILSPYSTSTNAKFTILKSLQNHLIEEELRLHAAEKGPGAKKKKKKKQEDDEKADIKEMGDALSGTTSEIIQVLLKDIMKGFFHCEKQVRISALQVIAIILRQGLIHPAQCIPFLVAISTDTERLCQVKAEQCLNDLDSRYQGFIHMKAFQGVKMSYDIQFVIQKADGGYVCAYRENENKIALINHVYGLIRNNKQYRRPFILSMLKQTDDIRSQHDLKYYLAENLAYIGYTTHEEPLFILYHIDKKASVSGANILQKFKELFHPSSTNENGNANECSSSDSSDDDDDDTPLLGCKGNEEELKKIVKQSFGCMLMLELKKYLKAIYGFTDSKCQKYSPLEPSKIYERPLNRKCDLDFVSEYKDFMFSDLEYEKCVKYYLKFKGMMMQLDKEQDDSDSDLDEKPDIKKKEEETPATAVVSNVATDGEVSSSSRKTRHSRESTPPKVETPVTSNSSKKKHVETTKNASSTKPDFKWTVELKIQLVELYRNAKLYSARGFASRLKTRWDEEVPKCNWMGQEYLRENAEQFEDEEIIGKKESRRSSRRSR